MNMNVKMKAKANEISESFTFNGTHTKVVPFVGTATNELGIAPPDDWDPVEILYHKLTIDLNNGTYSYAGSGIHNNGDIANFMTHLRLGNATTPRALYAAGDAPHIWVKQPCYVVVDIRTNANIHFMPGVPAIKTQNDNSAAYCALVHYGSDSVWTPSPINAPNSTCQIISFAVVDPQPQGDDLFNYFCMLPGGVPSQLTVDPAIKNRG